MFKKLKSIFIIEDENEKKAAAQKAATGSSKSPKSTPAKSSKGAAPASKKATATKSEYDPKKAQSGKVDEKFINRLLGALEEHNVEGFDYLEYKQSLQNLGNVEMEERTRFQSALAMAKTMGATPAKLTSSANHYLKVLSAEETKFLEAFKSQQTRQVSNRNAEIKKYEDGIAQRKAQIEKLQKEIAAGEKALAEKKSNINQANAKVNATKEGFYHAYHIVVSQITADLEKMKKYLS